MKLMFFLIILGLIKAPPDENQSTPTSGEVKEGEAKGAAEDEKKEEEPKKLFRYVTITNPTTILVPSFENPSVVAKDNWDNMFFSSFPESPGEENTPGSSGDYGDYGTMNSLAINPMQADVYGNAHANGFGLI